MIRKIENIDQFNRFFGQPTLHPHVSVVDLGRADLSLFSPTDFGMYCVALLDTEFGEIRLRNSGISYGAGSVLTIKSGDIVSADVGTGVHPKGRMLVFRQELIADTGLGRDFHMFNFFDYDVSEALELSESERRVMLNCFANIGSELYAPDDEFTGHMLRLGIGQLLSYCRRYYDRQFDVRKLRKNDFIIKLESLLNNYIGASEMSSMLGYPTVAWCAGQFNLSPNYFGEMVKRQTHITAQEYIHGKILEKAKAMLLHSDQPVNEIAEQLGFAYSNHFTRFFRTRTGMSPSDYRKKR
ncbi:MAG: AraC family transcriptional regulator [Bacteroidales bacterium]|nr:AraC family transcriptional regulator [Candidatus Cacconaster scatequi]